MTRDDFLDIQKNWDHKKLEQYIQLLLDKFNNQPYPYDYTISLEEASYKPYPERNVPDSYEQVTFVFKLHSPSKELSDRKLTVSFMHENLWWRTGWPRLDMRMGISKDEPSLVGIVMKRILGAISECMSVYLEYLRHYNPLNDCISLICSYRTYDKIRARGLDASGHSTYIGSPVKDIEWLGQRNTKWKPGDQYGKED